MQKMNRLCWMAFMVLAWFGSASAQTGIVAQFSFRQGSPEEGIVKGTQQWMVQDGFLMSRNTLQASGTDGQAAVLAENVPREMYLRQGDAGMTVVFEVQQQAFAVALSYEELLEANQAGLAGGVIKPTGNTRDIQGQLCTEYEISSGGITTVVWLAEALAVDLKHFPALTVSQFGLGIISRYNKKGLPMEIHSYLPNGKLIFTATCTQLEQRAIPAQELQLPAGVQAYTTAQLRQQLETQTEVLQGR
jgi:hypothetical protein